MAWSSRQVLLISIATGFAFCFATIYAQRSMAKYIERKVYEGTRQEQKQNPMVGMGLVSERYRRGDPHPRDDVPDPPNAPKLPNAPKAHASPPGSGARWTPLPA